MLRRRTCARRLHGRPGLRASGDRPCRQHIPTAARRDVRRRTVVRRTGGRSTAIRRSNELVAAALVDNTDLRIAVARIEEAERDLREVDAALFPEVDLRRHRTRSRVEHAVAPPPSGVPLRCATTCALPCRPRSRSISGAACAARPRRRARKRSARATRKDVVTLTLAGCTAQTYFSAALARRADRGDARDTAHARRFSYTIVQPARRGRARLRPRVAPGPGRARRCIGAAARSCAPARARRAPARHADRQARPEDRPGDLDALPRPAACRRRACPRCCSSADPTSAGRAGPGRGQRADRRGDGGAAPDDFADRRLSAPRALRCRALLRYGSRIWSHRLRTGAADLRRRPAARPQSKGSEALRSRKCSPPTRKSIQTAFREVADALTDTQQTTAAADGSGRARRCGARRAAACESTLRSRVLSPFLDVLDAQRTRQRSRACADHQSAGAAGRKRRSDEGAGRRVVRRTGAGGEVAMEMASSADPSHWSTSHSTDHGSGRRVVRLQPSVKRASGRSCATGGELSSRRRMS